MLTLRPRCFLALSSDFLCRSLTARPCFPRSRSYYEKLIWPLHSMSVRLQVNTRAHLRSSHPRYHMSSSNPSVMMLHIISCLHNRTQPNGDGRKIAVAEPRPRPRAPITSQEARASPSTSLVLRFCRIIAPVLLLPSPGSLTSFLSVVSRLSRAVHRSLRFSWRAPHHRGYLTAGIQVENQRTCTDVRLRLHSSLSGALQDCTSVAGGCLEARLPWARSSPSDYRTRARAGTHGAFTASRARRTWGRSLQVIPRRILGETVKRSPLQAQAVSLLSAACAYATRATRTGRRKSYRRCRMPVRGVSPLRWIAQEEDLPGSGEVNL